MSKCSESSSLNPLDPIDKVYVKETIAFLLAGMPETITDPIFDTIYNKCVASAGGDSAIYTCDVMYCTLMGIIKYLLRSGWNSGGTVPTGALKRRKDTEAGVTIEEEYDTASTPAENGWDQFLNYYLENPEDVCDCLGVTTEEVGSGGRGSMIKIGGTDANEVVRNDNDPSLNTMWDKQGIGTRYSSMRSEKRKAARRRSKQFYR